MASKEEAAAAAAAAAAEAKAEAEAAVVNVRTAALWKRRVGVGFGERA